MLLIVLFLFFHPPPPLSASPFYIHDTVMEQGLDSHRYSAVLFEDVARRRGLRLICIDRPGRGDSDPLPLSTPPSPARAAASGHRIESHPRTALQEALETAVVDTVRQASQAYQ